MSGKALTWTCLSIVLLFIYAPIVVMISLAFNESSLYELPFKFTLVWFEKLSRNHVLLDASRNSVLIAAANSLLSTALGTMAPD